MATVGSVDLTQPASDPNINEAATYAQEGDGTEAALGGLDYDMHFQYDQGTSTWIDIPSSGSELTTADTNPILGHSTKGTTSITVTGVGAGTYSVRIQTVDNNDGGALDTSGTQTVTVSAVSGTRRVMVIS